MNRRTLAAALVAGISVVAIETSFAAASGTVSVDTGARFFDAVTDHGRIVNSNVVEVRALAFASKITSNPDLIAQYVENPDQAILLLLHDPNVFQGSSRSGDLSPSAVIIGGNPGGTGAKACADCKNACGPQIAACEAARAKALKQCGVTFANAIKQCATQLLGCLDTAESDEAECLANATNPVAEAACHAARAIAATVCAKAAAECPAEAATFLATCLATNALNGCLCDCSGPCGL